MMGALSKKISLEIPSETLSRKYLEEYLAYLNNWRIKMTSTHKSSIPHSNSLHSSSSNADFTHKVSFSRNTGFSNYKLEGSLKTLVNAMNNVRNSMQSPNALQSIASSEKINATTVAKILNNISGLATNSYPTGKFQMNTGGYAHRSSGSLDNTGNPRSQLANWSQHASSGNGSMHGNTASYRIRNLLYSKSYSFTDFTVLSGKATATHRNQIFDVMNNKKITTGTNKNFSWTITGNTHAQHSSCSVEVKKEIKPFNRSALDILNSTKVISFKYIDDPDQIVHYGFIAEDTPTELATEFHDRMDYTNCIGILIKAVQELQDLIKSKNV